MFFKLNTFHSLAPGGHSLIIPWAVYLEVRSWVKSLLSLVCKPQLVLCQFGEYALISKIYYRTVDAENNLSESSTGWFTKEVSIWVWGICSSICICMYMKYMVWVISMRFCSNIKQLVRLPLNCGIDVTVGWWYIKAWRTTMNHILWLHSTN